MYSCTRRAFSSSDHTGYRGAVLRTHLAAGVMANRTFYMCMLSSDFQHFFLQKDLRREENDEKKN